MQLTFSSQSVYKAVLATCVFPVSEPRRPRFAMPRHVVIIPYYCDEEIVRYQKIADWMLEHCRLPLDCTFLLAASPRATVSDSLQQTFSRLGPAVSFQCPTQVFGYPAGPSAMFWDSMDYIAENFSGDGFALWFESDMVAVRSDWMEQLTVEWDQQEETPLLMGCYVPKVYKFRWLRQKKLMLEAHINGGACYALDFARRLPDEARTGVFDMAVYPFARECGKVVISGRIGFSTNSTVRRDVQTGEKCVLHGFMQDKDQFVDSATRPVTAREKSSRFLFPLQERMEDFRRWLRVTFVRKGPRAMLENTLLTQKRMMAGKIPVDAG